MIALNRIVGEISGMVICRRRAAGPAPSISAASYSSFGTPCSAARKMIMRPPPTLPHSEIRIIAGITQVRLVNQSGPLTPMNESA
jgi:hypothetical protein